MSTYLKTWLMEDLEAYGQCAQVAQKEDEQEAPPEGAQKDQSATNAQIATFH
jgi:hypothetical protein